MFAPISRGWRSVAVIVASLGLYASGDISARAEPLVLEENARIVAPDADFTLSGQVAVEGDFIIAAGVKFDYSLGYIYRRGYLFRRASNGSWNFVRSLFSDQASTAAGVPPVSIAMGEGIAAIVHGNGGASTVLRVFQRSGTDYIELPAIGNPRATDLEINSGRILASDGSCSWDAKLFQPNPSGTWVQVESTTGIFRGCDDEFDGGDVAFAGGTFLVGNPYGEDDPPQAQLFHPGFNKPSPQLFLNPYPTNLYPGQTFADKVALEGEIGVISGQPTIGDHVISRPQNSTTWSYEQLLQPDDFLAAGPASYLELESGKLLRPRQQGDGAVGVFRRASQFHWDYVARLVPSTGKLSNLGADSSGNRVVAQGVDAVYVWDLPTDFSQPGPRYDDFNDGNAAGWNAQIGSDFAVVTGTDSLVYRQRSLAGNATSIFTSAPARNQSIQADITPTEFQAADRWLGLAVRYVDINNYYYVTMRQSNVLQLRRIVNGAFVTLASMPLTVTPGRTYNIRLEAIGNTLRAYVNGALALRAHDESLAQGQVALMTYRTRADFDNVIATSNLRTTLFSDDFESSHSWWTTEPEGGVGQWSVVTDGASHVYQQSSLADGARVFAGPWMTGDQIVQARIKATAFGAGAGRWFGLMARHDDENNYYYLTVRNDNTVSLRRLINGGITVLDSAALPVTTNTWYDLRLEVIGTSLRGYVNGRMLVEATDATFAVGSYGVAMYKAAVHVDDFNVTQP